MLKLHWGSRRIDFPPLSSEQLGSIDSVKKWLKGPVWQIVTDVARENQKRIIELSRELKADLVAVEK